MVINTNKHTRKTPAKQGDERVPRKPIRIGAATPYDFKGSHLTPYGGLLPAATMLENLGFQELVERHVTIKRMTTSMPGFRFVMAMILALYVGWSRLNHFQFLQQEPMLTGILGVEQLPVQSTFWRFLESLHLVVARQLLEVTRRMRQRVWEAAHVALKEVTLDTDTTVQTVYGRRKMGARKGYNPKHRGKKSYQPILTFLAETREYISGELRKGERPTGKQIAAHLDHVFAVLPEGVQRCYARADSGLYCWDTVEAYEKHGCQFVLSAQKTPRLVAELKAALDRVAAHRCGWSVRVSLSAGRLGKSLPLRGVAVPEETEAEESQRARTISVVRHPGIRLPGVRYGPGRAHRRGGGVLPTKGGCGEPDQGSQ